MSVALPISNLGAGGITLCGRGPGCQQDLTLCLPVFLSCALLPTLKVYLRDSFGLKTLLARGAIVKCTEPGVVHTAWHSNRTLYETCIEPWLS